jgi:ribosomal protein S18 acetylase RimI-like enzyme
MVELRSFRPEDADGVWELHDAALEAAGVHGGRGPWEADLDDVGASYLAAGGEFLVARVGATVIGMGGLLPHSAARGEIKRMRVHSDFQRRGLGRRILEALEQRARALGLRELCLDTTEDQGAARRLYESAGYRETGRREAARFTFVDFEKSL